MAEERRNRIINPRIPGATYRLQFNKQFRFVDTTRIICYLHDLGISDIYSSPYFKAKTGSLHGYDITNHYVLNPEVGTEEDYRAMVDELKHRGMGQVLDIVPNHMSVESPENNWWQDVLENGPSSSYASYFDIDWAPVKKELRNKVLIPVLGDQYGNVLERGELKLIFEEGAFFVYFYDHKFPLRPQTYVSILEHRIEALKGRLSQEAESEQEYLSIITALHNLPSYTEEDPVRVEERLREKEIVKRRLAALVRISETVREHLEENIRIFSGTEGDRQSFDLLDDLLNQQIYRLSHWRVATEEINYRRFFDVNGLGAVRMERPDVFRSTHELVFRLIREGSVTGLRLDHPDGLYNPVEYFHRLQRGCFVRLTAPSEVELSPEQEREWGEHYDDAVLAEPTYKPFYIVGEKILTKAERMPEDWPMFSTTGYVFLNSVNGVFVDSQNAKAFDDIYAKFIKKGMNLQDIIPETKKLVMQVSMASEMNTLGHYLNDLSEKNRHTRDFTLNSLRNAIVEVVACFPVYRTYINTWSVSDRDRQVVELAVSKAKRRNPAISESIFDFVKDVLLLRFPPYIRDEDKAAWLDFVMRFQQITGPVMAKGVEDTAFYVYNRLVSLNEVGGMPERFGTPLETFHGQNIERIKSWPHALITTATHDMKRGEDTRQRINVLSELPAEWGERVRKWARLNKKKKTLLEGNEAPDRNEEYLLYQTLIGAWPVEQDDTAHNACVQRIKDYMIKASREAKVNTSWINPNQPYEDGLLVFVEKLLRRSPDNEFLRSFLPFQQMISHYGMFNSLSQTLLKICAPGVPDFYQGTELWDFSLVDPDNRKNVDFDKRIAALTDITCKAEKMTAIELAWDLMTHKDDGRIKLYVMAQALRLRRENREVFETGEYLPLTVEGARSAHVCSFARKMADAAVIVAAPRLLTKVIAGPGALPIGNAVWDDTRILVPWAKQDAQFENIFTNERAIVKAEDGKIFIAMADACASFPLALLKEVQ